MAKGYQSYRGRRSAGTRLLIAVLVMILAAACCFLFAQRYIAYTDDGGMYLDLPFGRVDLPTPPAAQEPAPDQEEDPGPAADADPDPAADPEPAPPEMDLVVEPPAQPEEPEEPEEMAYGERRLVELAAFPAEGADLAAQLAAAGANGFLLPVRDNTGAVLYGSAAALGKALAEGGPTAAQLKALCAGEGVAVARFNCLHDSFFAWENMKEAAICQRNGFVWYDNHSYHWLDPEKALARSYVISLAVECAQLGFDELLLEELVYPASGRTQKIDYSGNTLTKSEALAQLLRQLREALKPYGTWLSLPVTEELLLAGSDEVTGQDLAVLLPLVDAVYVETADPAAVSAQLSAIAGESAPALVVTGSQLGEGNWCVPAA